MVGRTGGDFFKVGDKTPSSNGFSMTFWHSNWDFGKDEIMRFFRDFFYHGKLERNLNATFLVLKQKKGSAEDFKDFKPISLVGSLYKLLAKVLANKLKKVVGKVVAKFQSAL